MVVAPVALNGPILTIRRFPDTPITMEKLIELGSITPECASFLEKLVRARYSIVIGGGTGSGKTTFLGALSEYIPKDERIITIEDNAELKLQGIADVYKRQGSYCALPGSRYLRMLWNSCDAYWRNWNGEAAFCSEIP